jgi:mannose-6-phosphate isomerase-like protein (cupin superfamily)
MRITRKSNVLKPSVNTTSEQIYELIGRPDALGTSKLHSFGHVVIPPSCSSRLHYHPIAEETYYILKGQARMVIDEKEYALSPGDVVLIMPPEKHQIFSIGDTDLEFIAVCAPAWEATNSVFLDEEKHE